MRRRRLEEEVEGEEEAGSKVPLAMAGAEVEVHGHSY